MLKVAQVPSEMRPFFEQVEDCLSVAQMAHLTLYVIGLTLCFGRGTVSALSRLRLAGPHRTKLGEFLTKLEWNSRRVLQRLSLWLLARARALPRRKGERDLDVIFPTIDETKQQKRGKKMAGRHKLFVPSQKRYVKGTSVVEMVLVYRGITIPWDAELYLPEAEAKRQGVPFRTQVDIATDMLKALPEFEGLEVVTLFDSFYANKKIVRVLKERGWFYISVAKSNRRVVVRGQKPATGRRTVASYMDNVFGRGSRYLTLGQGRSRRRFQVAVRNAALQGLGAVRFVFSQIVRDGRRRIPNPEPVAIITNLLDHDERQILLWYQNRWNIELFFAEVKQRFGWSQYQTRSLTGAQRHLHLANMAHALLTHLRLRQCEDAIAAGRQFNLSASSRLGLWMHARDMVFRELLQLIEHRGVDILRRLMPEIGRGDLMKAA